MEVLEQRLIMKRTWRRYFVNAGCAGAGVSMGQKAKMAGTKKEDQAVRSQTSDCKGHMVVHHCQFLVSMRSGMQQELIGGLVADRMRCFHQG